MEVYLAVALTALTCILIGIIVKVISNSGNKCSGQSLSPELQEISKRNNNLQQSVDKILLQISTTGKLSESQHYEVRQVLSLLGQQVQNLSSVIHQLSGAFGSRGATNNINVQTGDQADNDNTQAGQIND
jgi:predicted PurR-regulated permease PerM